MTLFPLNALDLSIYGLVLLLLVVLYRLRRAFVLPPGPKGLPIVGNFFDMPSEKDWIKFAQWGQNYGDICSVVVLGQPLIILNSARAATSLLDKKSALNSERPEPVFAGELIGWKNALILSPYGEKFKRFRKVFHNTIGTSVAIRKFHPGMEFEARQFLRNVLAKPNDFLAHIRHSVGASVLRDTYGYEVKEANDPYINLADQTMDQFSRATAPPGYLVDFIPALRHIPEWVPGAYFKKEASAWSSTLLDLVNLPFNFVKQQVAVGIAPISFVSELLNSKSLSAQEESDMKWAAASLYGGAADTTVAAIHSFFLAMTLFPDVALKAQAEIDSVIGNERLPSFKDRQALPYVDALVKEIYRWHTVTPTGVAHRQAQDDIHEGFLIPRSALIIPNIWGMTHDEHIYKYPMTFNPERYFPSGGSEPDPRKVVFGFGRRTCPGSVWADASIYLCCATVLSVFDISKCVEDGVVIHPVHENTRGTISHPKPFRCSIKPRSKKAEDFVIAE